MKISPLGSESKSFSRSVNEPDTKSRKGRLLANHLELKDRVSLSSEARIQILRKPPAPPDHDSQSPFGRPEIPSFHPPLHSPIFQPPPFIAPEDCRLRIPEDGVRLEPPPNLGPIQPHPGIGRPRINPSNDFTIPEEPLESIKQGIADKLSVPVEDITIIDQKQVSWSDTSLGNPKPGGVYGQVIVPGYKITVQAGEDKQVSEFYAIMGLGGDQLQGIVGPDPFSGQPSKTIPEQPFPIPPIEEPNSPLPSIWNDLLERTKNNPALKALFKEFLESIKSNRASFVAWSAQTERIPGLKAFWEEIEKL